MASRTTTVERAERAGEDFGVAVDQGEVFGDVTAENLTLAQDFVAGDN